MRTVLLSFFLTAAFQLSAQSLVGIPTWMAKSIGVERARTARLHGAHSQPLNGQKKRVAHDFIGTYTMEAYRRTNDSAQVKFIIHGWQDSTKAIILMQGVEERASFTYIADLKADIAIIAERAGERAEAGLFRTSSVLAFGQRGSPFYYTVELSDTSTSRTTTLLGRTCTERVALGTARGTFWVDPKRPSPFEGMGGWLPLHYMPFQLFAKLNAQNHGLPMKYEEGKVGLRITKVVAGPASRPVVDLSDFRILQEDGVLLVRGALDEREHLIPDLPDQVALVGQQEAAAEPLPVVEDDMPEFPSGQAALYPYIRETLKYPGKAIEDGVEGVVHLTFVVETDGTLGDIKVLRGIGAGCDEEALRIVRGMPPWKPGKRQGKAVRMRYNLPILFQMR